MNEIEVLISSTLRLACPLIFASLGGFYSEKSGVVNIALEGKMLIGAFVAASVCFTTKNPYLGLMAAMIAGAMVGYFHAFCCVSLRADQIVVGTAVNLLIMGLIPLFCKSLYGTVGSTPSIALSDKFYPIHLPFLSEIPILKVFFSQVPLFYLAIICVGISYYVFHHTRFGLHIKAVGDHPQAAYSLGVNVVRVRFLAVILAGTIASIGGAYLSIAHGSGYARNMTSGRGFISLAALIFGKWRPVQACLACLLFGFADALQIRAQGSQIFGVEIPVQFIQMMPYLLTIIILAGFIGRSNPPLYIGIPWKKN